VNKIEEDSESNIVCGTIMRGVTGPFRTGEEFIVDSVSYLSKGGYVSYHYLHHSINGMRCSRYISEFRVGDNVEFV
jgi:hypothetical protein